MLDTRGVDGCIMTVLQDIARNPEKERRFRDALARNRDSVPPHLAAIRAINDAYNVGIPELDASSLRAELVGSVGKYLAEYFGCKLPLYPGIELTFLDMLAQLAEARIAILK